MGAFDKTLEFINSCSLEDLTSVLQDYGIEFEDNLILKNSVTESIYNDIQIIFKSPSFKVDLLRFQDFFYDQGELYSPVVCQNEFGENSFTVEFEKDAA